MTTTLVPPPIVDDATRRQFLALIGAGGLLTACGGDSNPEQAGPATRLLEPPARKALRAANRRGRAQCRRESSAPVGDNTAQLRDPPPVERQRHTPGQPEIDALREVGQHSTHGPFRHVELGS